MKARAFLRKVLPPGWLPYILHLRPRTWPIATFHMSVGFLLANGFHFTADTLRRWVIAVVAWVILGNGGTLSINSVFDKDEGDIGYLDDPPPPPQYLLPFSVIFMLLGLPLAVALGWRFLVAYLMSLAMSILYSVPPFRMKGRTGFDVLINAVGYGALTVYAGWAALGRSLTPPIVSVVCGSFFMVAGTLPLSQIYQIDEDRRRGDSTLAVLFTKRQSLLFAMAAEALAFVFVLSEAWTRYRALPSLGLLLALLAWGIVIFPWYAQHDRVDRHYEKRGFYRALWACFLTDLSIILAMSPAFVALL
ncbi:MAG: UbiA family prenyltransferase [Anaerolineae bacterium]|nr:UbiA family prenyltransferase [Anaerolineae bacterium]